MFKDDYKCANNQITASNDLKNRTLEKIYKPKETQFTSLMRYGLVCASFLFVVATFPLLQNLDEIENDESKPLKANGQFGETLPQTGIENYEFEDDSQPTKKPDENIKEITGKELNENKVELAVPESSLEKPKEEVSKPQDKLEDIPKDTLQANPKKNISLFACPMPDDKIIVNELDNSVPLLKILNFSDKEKYYVEKWDIKKITEYLGGSPTPSYIPSDLTISLPDDKMPPQNVVFNKDGTIAYDTFSLSFLEPQLTKEINPLRRTLFIWVAKDKFPKDSALYMKDDVPTSTIKGCELRVGMLKQAYEFNENKEPTKYSNKYVGEFIFNNVGYRIMADNLTQKEFTDVISSIIMQVPN